jgi:single-strand DNA-binding protein
MAINRVVLVGRLTKDPELRYTPSGNPVATLRLAVTDTYRRKQDGSGDFETNFFNVVAWQHSAEYAANYLTKGRLVAVDGRLQYREWQAQDGSRRSVIEIVAERLSSLERARETPASPDVDQPVAEPSAGGPSLPNESEEDLIDPFADQ